MINTDWGIPADMLSAQEAKYSGKKLFHKRWVTKEEAKQIREEHATYQSIRIIGFLLIFLALYLLINVRGISRDGAIFALLAVIYAAALLIAGIGLIKFKNIARNIAITVITSFLVLPFTPLFSDDKGAPLIIISGITGLYYLLRKTARKIFATPSLEKTDITQDKSSVARLAAYVVLLLAAVGIIYTIYDLRQARQMAAAACNRAEKGMLMEDFLSGFSTEDYKTIKGADYVMIVPGRGLARSYCTVYHNGQRITQARTGFND